MNLTWHEIVVARYNERTMQNISYMAVSGKVALENIQSEVHTTEANKISCWMSPSPYYGPEPMTWAGAFNMGWAHGTHGPLGPLPRPGPLKKKRLMVGMGALFWAGPGSGPKGPMGPMGPGPAHVAGTCPCHWPGPIIWAWSYQATEFVLPP